MTRSDLLRVDAGAEAPDCARPDVPGHRHNHSSAAATCADRPSQKAGAKLAWRVTSPLSASSPTQRRMVPTPSPTAKVVRR